MRLSLTHLLSLTFLLASNVFAGQPGEPQPVHICVEACLDWTNHINFTVPEDVEALYLAGNYYATMCMAPVIVDSYFYCAQAYCTPKEQKKGLQLWNASCKYNAQVSIPSIAQTFLPQDELDKLLRVPQSYAIDNASTFTMEPILPDAEWIALSRRTDAAFYRNYWLGLDATWAMYAYWGFVIAVGITYRLLAIVRSSPDVRTKHTTGAWSWFRRRILLPATFRSTCQDAFWGATVPPRVETLLLVIYVVFNFIMCFPGIDIFPGNMYFTTYAMQYSRSIADRTGFLAMAQVPLIWVFAMRNSPLLWVTGWSFSTFNNFHRWVARLMVVNAFVHAVAYSVNAFQYPGDWTESWGERYWWTGEMSFIAMCFILGFSIWWLRYRGYEVFLIIHILLAVVSLVGLYYHLQVDGDIWNGFIWPCVAIWAFDRVLRYGRMIYARFRAQRATAIATFDSASNMIRLDISDYLSKQSHPASPGLYYFLYTPLALRAYECHPFTLCSWNRPADSSAASTSSTPSTPMSGADEKAVVHQTSTDISTTSTVANTLLIRPYTSFTKRLLTKLRNSGSAEIPIALEGPYGEPLDLSNYSNTLILAAGSGIAAGISHIHTILARSSTARVHLIWVLPQRHLVDDVCANELAAVVRDERLKITVYLTSGTKSEMKDPEDDRLYHVIEGRPDVLKIMREARAQASVDLAITSCGTMNFADACRASVVEVLGENGKYVAYYNETVSW